MVIGVDLGATNIHAGLVDEEGRISEEVIRGYDCTSKHDVIEVLLDVLSSLKDKARSVKKSVKKIGLVCPGPVDIDSGLLINVTNLPEWGEVPIRDMISDATGMDVHLDNDAVGAVLAEAWVGKARGLNTFMAVTLGTGVGTGVVLDGRVFRGGRRKGTEWGHLIMSGKGLYRCGCGNDGCIETMCSATALVRLAQKRGLNVLSAKDVCKAAADKDIIALEVMDEFSYNLARALYNYSLVLGPEIIVICGGLSASHELFLPGVRKHFTGLFSGREYMMPPMGVEATRFPDNAGIIGAAYLCMEDRRIGL